MNLRANLLLSYFALTLFAILAFGINSYHVSTAIIERHETDHLDATTRVFARMVALSSESNPGKPILEAVSSIATNSHEELLLVLDDKANLVNDRSATAQQRALYQHWKGLQSGNTRQGRTRIGSDEFVWSLAPIPNTQFSILAIAMSANSHMDSHQILAVRLIVFGLITLWIAGWVILVIATKVSRKLNEQHKELERRAFTDPLTGLSNRIHLQRVLDEKLNTALKTNTTAMLIVMNLDRFKEINDSLGHHVGDEVLKLSAERLKSTVWSRDTVAHLGGDTFALLLPIADKSHCQSVITKMISAMTLPFIFKDITLELNATAGISIFPDDSTNANELVSHAEVAMYEAKNRNEPFLYYDQSFDPYSMERLKLLGDLKHATERNELFLTYQPLIDIQSGEVHSAEALVRWKCPHRGLVGPDKFIPIAEQTGLIRPMTYAIIRLAIAQAAEWQKKGINISIAINLSARLAHDRGIPDIVRSTLREFNITAASLEFEITETAIMLDPERTIEVLHKLHDMGAQLSVDDFGSGYTSLAFLKKLPVKTIKVDRSFVMNMLRDDNDRLVVHAVIELAHSMSRHVVAEGVETLEILNQLRKLSCDVAQGYYFSKPLPAPEFEVWLKGYTPARTV